jgi:hypothetical protein
MNAVLEIILGTYQGLGPHLHVAGGHTDVTSGFRRFQVSWVNVIIIGVDNVLIVDQLKVQIQSRKVWTV